MSPGCRTELESALASQGQISMDCRLELQTAFQTIGVDLEQSSRNEEAAPVQDRASQERRTPPNERPADAPTDTTTPILAIAGFVVALFGLAAGFVMYRQSQINPDAIQKPKKLSKKKVSVQRLMMTVTSDWLSMY